MKSSKTKYKDQLTAAVKQLEGLLNDMQEPKITEMKQNQIKKISKKEQIAAKEESLEIDMKYDEVSEQKELNYEDERVKDRWSRYIGAMGIDAVKKQAESQVLLVGLGAVGL